jgi:hypothetical protein
MTEVCRKSFVFKTGSMVYLKMNHRKILDSARFKTFHIHRFARRDRIIAILAAMLLLVLNRARHLTEGHRHQQRQPQLG